MTLLRTGSFIFFCLILTVILDEPLSIDSTGRHAEFGTAPQRDRLCGPRSIATIAMLNGNPFDLDEFIAACRPGPNGMSMLELKKASEKIGYQATGTRIDWERLVGMSEPLILYVSNDHFLVAHPGERSGPASNPAIRIYDPPGVAYYSSKAELDEIWNGEALLLQWRGELPLIHDEPRIVFDRLIHDFGLQPSSERINYRFAFKNAGKSPLEIQDLKKSCGCTNATAGSDYLLPGEESYIEATIDLSGRQAMQIQTITVFTNDPLNPSIDLLCQGFVEDDYRLNKARLRFDGLTRSSSAWEEITVTGGKYADARVQSFEFVPPAGGDLDGKLRFSCDIDHSEGAPDAPTKLMVRVGAHATDLAQLGSISAVLKLLMADPASTVIEIPIDVAIGPRISMQPSDLSFGVVRPGMSVIRQARIVMQPASGIDPKSIEYALRNRRPSAFEPRIVDSYIDQGDLVLNLAMSVPARIDGTQPSLGDGWIEASISDAESIKSRWTYLLKPAPAE